MEKDPFMERIKKSILLAALTVVGLLIVYLIRNSLLIIYVSCIFAIVLSPAVHWVCRLRIVRWHPSRGMAILLLVIAVLLGLVIMLGFGLPQVIADIQQLFILLPQAFQRLQDYLRQFSNLPQMDWSTLEKYASAIASGLTGVLGSIASGIVSIAAAIVLTAYFILEGEELFERTMALFPADARDRLKPVLRLAAERMRRWLMGQTVLMLILGSASVLVFGLLGVRYFYLLGVFAGLANFVPMLGPTVSLILAGLVAALDSWSKLAGVLVFFFVYQQVENAFLTPRIMKTQVQLSASAVLIALLIGSELAGVIGAMMAIPTAVLISVLIDFFLIPKRPGGRP
jgi:predicted PurR-regulated permease PerM